MDGTGCLWRTSNAPRVTADATITYAIIVDGKGPQTWNIDGSPSAAYWLDPWTERVG